MCIFNWSELLSSPGYPVLWLRGAAAVGLRRKGLEPRRLERVDGEARHRPAWLVCLWSQRRFVEAIDPARRGGVRPLVGAAVEA